MSPERKGRLRSLFRRSTEPATPATPAKAAAGGTLAARVSFRSQLTQIRNPSSEVGPEPVQVPVTGYSVLLEVVADGTESVVITGLGAEITNTLDVTFDGVARTMSRMPDMIGSAELAESARGAVETYRPLDPPHCEVLLDGRPPVVQYADGSSQPALRFPLTLRPGDLQEIYLAPVTADTGLVSWNLLVEWVSGGEQQNAIRWPLTVTADTGHTTAYPDRPPTASPVGRIAPDHWEPGRPPRPADPAMTIYAHGSPDSLSISTDWGEEERYVAARRANDYAGMCFELFGLSVLMPRRADESPFVSEVEGEGLIWVFTSPDRMKTAVAGQGIDTYQASIEPFLELLEDISETELGICVDPNTDVAFRCPPKLLPLLLKHKQKVLAEVLERRSEPPG